MQVQLNYTAAALTFISQAMCIKFKYVLGSIAKVKAVAYLTSVFSTRCMEKTAFRYTVANTYKPMRIEPSYHGTSVFRKSLREQTTG